MKDVVLLVDDDEQASSRLCKDLKSEGFEVICCYDGETALDMLESINISIILLDYVLPKMKNVGFMNLIINHGLMKI